MSSNQLSIDMSFHAGGRSGKAAFRVDFTTL